LASTNDEKQKKYSFRIAMAASFQQDIADVIIIGAGISGMTVGIDMIRLGNGRNFVILEKGYRVGGTWSDNEYPGCCCDVWSHLYSLSFSPNPYWSREYPTQPEIQRYLAKVAQKYDLGRHIHFNTVVDSCVFDPKLGLWTTTVHRGKSGETQTYRSRFIVSAVGQLNLPKYPEIPGLNGFKGKVMHSARWDKSVDLSGKRIGVIGNG
jgi:cation diffusion facilitator CzcD-associated flavoprotein CzcO